MLVLNKDLFKLILLVRFGKETYKKDENLRIVPTMTVNPSYTGTVY